MSYTILIPARLHSTRLPEKPLADIAGLPMVVQVAQRVQQAPGVDRVVVAADHERIVQACTSHGIEALLTDNDHPSGSDRLAQACSLLQLPDDAIVVNVQGDEPLIDPALPGAVARLLQQTPAASMATAAHRMHDSTDLRNPNAVKVVCDAQGMALYFSRAPIPWWRDGWGAAMQGDRTLPASHLLENSDPKASPAPPLRHIGIYAYRCAFLKQFPQLPPAPIEKAESLEQLRALWHGHRIAVHLSDTAPGRGVDTPEDLAAVQRLFAQSQ
ncbi:MAG: 3-deoxy-manno-octulosonate cytidylyltransferase [Brachymonas sp.]|nr:3-deoxy-manno-octulosonate cytidylyltransferase [Brachymonas sp.]